MIGKLFPFLFVFFVFLDPLFMGLCSVTGIQNDGMVLRIYLVIVFSISLLSYWKIKSNVGFSRDINLFIALGIFGGLYLLTTQIYGLVSGLFLGHFFRWGAQCVPAVLMGVAFVNYEEKERIYKYIPLVVFFLTPFIAHISMTNNADRAQYVDEDSGLNYQLVAYYMALLFCTSAFYQFLCPQKSDSKLLNVLTYGMMAIQGIVCAMSGGRGGFVLLIVYVIYLIYMFLKKDLFSVSQIFVLLSCCAIVSVLIANYVNLWDSVGFQRTIHPMDQNIGRVDDWREVLDIFYRSPFIGNGLGSNFYTWGFYSHNMILDFLSETGVIGFVFFVLLFYNMEKYIIRLSYESNVVLFISIFAIFGLVMNFFSGYWISNYYHWLILGVYYGLKTRDVDYLY